MKKIRLGVNIDHVATLRQARKSTQPVPLFLAQEAIKAGADSITLHLREDRRHIQDEDLALIQKLIPAPINLEMAATEEMLKIALAIKPEYVCIVPEKRQELTTEGGLDVASQQEQIGDIVEELQENGILVSLFVDPDPEQIDACLLCDCHAIELHTGKYAEGRGSSMQKIELQNLASSAQLASSDGVEVHAGHGLDYFNVQKIAQIPEVVELNIGHAIVAKALECGMFEAVRKMKQLL